jgi:hypothetical protein
VEGSAAGGTTAVWSYFFSVVIDASSSHLLRHFHEAPLWAIEAEW